MSFFCIPDSINAQYQVVDSIYTLLQKESISDSSHYFTTLSLFDQIEVLSQALGDGYEINLDSNNISYDKHLTRALTWSQKQSKPVYESRLLKHKIQYESHNNNHFEVIKYANQKIKSGHFESNWAKYVTYDRLAKSYRALEYYHDYFNVATRRIELVKLLNFNSHAIQYATMTLGDTYYKLRLYAKARYHYHFSLKDLPSAIDTIMESSAYNNIGLSFMKEHKKDSAIYYFKKAITTVGTQKRAGEDVQYFTRIIKSNLAKVNISNNDYSKIIPIVLAERGTKESPSEDHIFVGASNYLAEIYYEMQNYYEAEKFFDIKSDKFKNIDNSHFLRHLKIKAKINLAMGNQIMADKYFSQMEKMVDSIESIKIQNSNKIAAILYESELQEKRINEQNTKLEANSSTISKHQSRQKYLSYALLGLFTFFLSLYIMYRKVRSQKAQIEIQSEILDNNLEHKEILLKEINHRVKNNLQVISGMILLQSSKSKNKDLIDHLQVIKNRISSIGLIHEMLYNEDDDGKINIGKYIKKLHDQISTIFNKKAKLVIPKSEVKLNLNSSIPIGMIMNELITNSYKHAFAADEGQISINITKNNDTVQIEYKDNGKTVFCTHLNEESLGIKIINLLSNQLSAKSSYTLNQGCQFFISFIEK